jgi:hypothetical protein
MTAAEYGESKITMSKERKKEVIQQFKERKSAMGVFAVRCNATGRVWVGCSRNLEAAKNGIWFGLRNASHRDKALQNEWTAHGEGVFQYEVLQKVDEDVAPLLVTDLLNEMKQRWMAQLGAQGLL